MSRFYTRPVSSVNNEEKKEGKGGRQDGVAGGNTKAPTGHQIPPPAVGRLPTKRAHNYKAEEYWQTYERQNHYTEQSRKSTDSALEKSL